LKPSASVSVIIPAYNSGKTILRALHSVFNQSLTPREVIVVDDGSSDNTAALVRENYPDAKLILQKNAGAAAARNTGAKASSGEFIAFLDSDDFWHKQKLEFQASIFKDHIDIGMCSTTCMFFTESSLLKNRNNLDEPIADVLYDRIPFARVFRHPYLGTPSVMLRKAMFEQIGGFNENLETAEDVDLWIRSAYQAGYILIRNSLTYVVEQSLSLSSRAAKSPYESHLKVIDHFIAKNSLSLWFRLIVVRKTKATIYCKWGSSALVSCNERLAIKKCFKSLQFFPNARAAYLLLKAIAKTLLHTK
jgi:glycosyltransferase involved in cell wall biosynthesis